MEEEEEGVRRRRGEAWMWSRGSSSRSGSSRDLLTHRRGNLQHRKQGQKLLPGGPKEI